MTKRFFLLFFVIILALFLAPVSGSENKSVMFFHYVVIKPLPVANWNIYPKAKVAPSKTSHPITFLPSITPVTWPFPESTSERQVTLADNLPQWWADNQACSVGCLPPGVIPGWPIKPFHQQHPIRNGFNELRSSSFHHAIDIQVKDGTTVYAIQAGSANILVPSGPEEQVEVGNYIYWHVKLVVHQGEYIIPYQTILGYTMPGFGHLALAEVGGVGGYLNPLRPQGTALSPWSDTATPIIGKPYVEPDGRAEIAAFDPQSFHQKTTYLTPVIAPVAIAWRLFDASGNSVSPLEWAFRGTQNYPWSDDSLIYWPSAHSAGFSCFATRLICKPDWQYVLAGGLAPNISLPGPGKYRLSVYVWGAGGVVAARDSWLEKINGQIIELQGS